MSVAIEYLKGELDDQIEKLKAVKDETAEAIAEGDKARCLLEAQERHVGELRQAIATLGDAGKLEWRHARVPEPTDDRP